MSKQTWTLAQRLALSGPTSSSRARSEAAWPAENIAQLTDLVNGGVSFAEIGRRMGISKNMAIGKAQRLNLTGPRSRPSDNSTAIKRLDAMLAIFPGFCRCVFPHGDPGDPTFRFCGTETAIALAPYCDAHMRLTHALALTKTSTE